ncbi:hypothetical protein HWV62_231 [Athelia sp. TMB]|nr:hypothetical protein HWV62_231 [Athelia sp. TMB]
MRPGAAAPTGKSMGLGTAAPVALGGLPPVSTLRTRASLTPSLSALVTRAAINSYLHWIIQDLDWRVHSVHPDQHSPKHRRQGHRVLRQRILRRVGVYRPVTLASDLAITNQSIGVASNALNFSHAEGILGSGSVTLHRLHLPRP